VIEKERDRDRERCLTYRQTVKSAVQGITEEVNQYLFNTISYRKRDVFMPILQVRWRR
jgi:hypothetical protein